MPSGKTIRLYLVDGTPTGLQIVELSNWTGKAVVCQRTQLPQLAQRPEAKRTGIYILIGSDPVTPSQECAYIGEGDSVLDRLIRHDQDEEKDFWTSAVIFISKDENLTKAHVRYLEAELIRRALEANRVRLFNKVQPSDKLLPEPEIADMQSYLEQVELILPVLSFTLLKPVPKLIQLQTEPASESADISPVFEMSPVGTKATAREVKGEFIVLEGSTARKAALESQTAYRSLRNQLIDEHRLVLDSDGAHLRFAEDIAFKSPSAAAAVVFGGNQNGPSVWRIQGVGTTYKQWKEARIREAEILGEAEQ